MKFCTKILGTAILVAGFVSVSPTMALATDLEFGPVDGEYVAQENRDTEFELNGGEDAAVFFNSPAADRSIIITSEAPQDSRAAKDDDDTTAATCVSAEQDGVKVTVYNDCPTPMRVKVIMTGPVGAQDARCATVASGQEEVVAEFSVPYVTRIDRVVNC